MSLRHYQVKHKAPHIYNMYGDTCEHIDAWRDLIASVHLRHLIWPTFQVTFPQPFFTGIRIASLKFTLSFTSQSKQNTQVISPLREIEEVLKLVKREQVNFGLPCSCISSLQIYILCFNLPKELAVTLNDIIGWPTHVPFAGALKGFSSDMLFYFSLREKVFKMFLVVLQFG